MSNCRPKKAFTGACMDKVDGTRKEYIPLTIKLEPISKEEISKLRNNVYPLLIA